MRSFHQNDWESMEEYTLTPVSKNDIAEWERNVIESGARGLNPFELGENYPLVTIGRPESWAIQEVTENLSIIESKLQESDFYLIRLACSFRPRHRGVIIKQASFSLQFEYKRGHKEPVLFDMYPGTLYYRSKKDVKVKINPTLKFFESEVSLGEASYEFCYDSISPQIISYGIGESRAEWDYVYDKLPESIPIEGSKIMLIIVKTEKGSRPYYGNVLIKADLLSQGQILKTHIPYNIQKPLTLIP